jgi:hypothetical protein
LTIAAARSTINGSDMRLRRSILVFALTAVLAPRAHPTAQEPTLAEVLDRAGAYVTEFQRLLSGVVAEESYVQDIRESSSSLGARGGPRLGTTHRELKSDLLLVRPAGSDRWIQFRDVFDVDGRAVRDRSERLMKLFVEPSASTARQAEEIVTESSRYNIGNILRTINVPVFALLVLEPHRQSHFKFTHVRTSAPPIPVEKPLPPDTWTVLYEETAPDTMIRTTNNRDLACHGRFWLEASTGRVLMTELVASDVYLSGRISVAYQADMLPNVLVPVAMREQYLERRNNTRIEGAAAYSKFRQFQVKVDEKIAPIKQ